MKTEIIIKRGWELLITYDFLLTMSKGDVVTYLNIDYLVDCSILDADEGKMIILVE